MALVATGIVLLCFIILAFNRAPADIVLLGGLTLMLLTGVVSVDSAVAGFSNSGVLTLAALFVVVEGLRQTGAISSVARYALNYKDNESTARWRIMAWIGSCSAFVNNTPLVAIATPLVLSWSKKMSIAPSRLLLPLSYAAIAGGTCTLLGSSVNLALAGMLNDATEGTVQLQFWEPTLLGLPVAMVVFLYSALTATRLLPERGLAGAEPDKVGRYRLEFTVEPGGVLVGKTIEAAGLRHLRGMYLAELFRNGELIPAVAPDQLLQSGDQLLFVGNSAEVSDLMTMEGLKPSDSQVYKLEGPRHRRVLVEVVIAGGAGIAGKSIRDAKLRTRLGAVVLAVHRHGEALTGRKIGDIVLASGDLLLLETAPALIGGINNSRDFLMATTEKRPVSQNSGKRYVAAGLFLLMMCAATVGLFDLMVLAWLCAGLMVITRCLSVGAARDSVEWEIVLVLAAAIGLGNGLVESGAIANLVSWLPVHGEMPAAAIFAALFSLAALISAFVTNSAAVVILFPIAQSLSVVAGLDLKLTTLVLLMGASASFMTPMAYQTNLMVYNAGSYRFADYLRFGAPLTVLVGLVVVGLASLLAI